jgi:hypothetical protein
MWRESEAMLIAMLMLHNEHSVPSLSVHDSLIVPASKVEVASKMLVRAFGIVTGAHPLLKVNKPLHTTQETKLTEETRRPERPKRPKRPEAEER